MSMALPCLLVNLNKSMGLRLEFAIRNMRLCCTLAHCSTSTSVKTNRPIGHPQKKHWTCGPKMTTFILKNGHFSKVPWPDLAPVCFFPGTKCTISPTYIIAINLESEMFRQTKFVKIGQLDYLGGFYSLPCPAPHQKIFSRPALKQKKAVLCIPARKQLTRMPRRHLGIFQHVHQDISIWTENVYKAKNIGMQQQILISSKTYLVVATCEKDLWRLCFITSSECGIKWVWCGSDCDCVSMIHSVWLWIWSTVYDCVWAQLGL